MDKKPGIIIVGCGAAGGTAAQFARKTNRKIPITILEKDSYPQYSKCGLPYVISNDIPSFDHLIEFSEEWFRKARIDLYLETTVETIDTNNKQVIARKNNEEIVFPYTSIIIATGARAKIPPIRNLEKGLPRNVFLLRTIEDGEGILDILESVKKIVIVGAGFIGLELAESFHKKNKDVTIIEALPSILPNTLDKDMSTPIQEELSKYLTILVNHLVEEVHINNGFVDSITIRNTETREQRKMDVDLLVIATGTKPEVSLAKQIGCRIGVTGGIIVDNHCMTSIPNVYAVGDCTEYYDFINGKPMLVGLGSIGVRQGIVAGVNAAGGERILPKGFLQTCTSRFFNIEVASVGLPSSRISDDIIQGRYIGSSLPEYYPGGKPVTVKILVDREKGVIVGGQIVGENAGQRINTIACAVRNQMHIDDFRDLETAYAPPIAPTLDSITIAGEVASIKWRKK